MNCFPSPPSSPVIPANNNNNNNNSEKVICGSCDKPLSNDWFCSTCHTKCNICNRFLNDTEYCTRCWLFDDDHQSLVRKELSFRQDYVRQFYIMYYSQQSSPNSKSNQHKSLCIA